MLIYILSGSRSLPEDNLYLCCKILQVLSKLAWECRFRLFHTWSILFVTFRAFLRFVFDLDLCLPADRVFLYTLFLPECNF